MDSMKQILLGLLLHCFFLTAKPECIYYESTSIICRNMHLKEGDILKSEGQTDPDMTVNHLYFQEVSGVLNELTVSFFPKARLVAIEYSTIEKLRLPSLVASLFINNTTLSGANSSQFWKDCCLNIKGLQITYSPKWPVSIEHFESLKQLKVLVLSHINESVIPKHLTKSTFESISSLEHLILDKVGLEEVDEDAFENLPNLKALSLRNNTITQIKPNTFKSLTNLEELHLIGNNIENLSLEMLSEQKQLKRLFLPYKNFLKFGAKETKKALPNLKGIGLDKYSPESPVVKSFVSIGIHVSNGVKDWKY